VSTEALVQRSQEPLGNSNDLETVQRMSQEIKDMLKDLNPRELELARFKINNVLKSISEEDASKETVAKIMEIVNNTFSELEN